MAAAAATGPSAARRHHSHRALAGGAWRAAASRRPATFFLSGALLFFLITAATYRGVVLRSFRLRDRGYAGCRPDGEGSWAVGIFYGDNPFQMVPIESAGKSDAASAAWPVANPVITCVTATDAGFPSNFVADPFLFVQDNILYLFFETKTITTTQGDIGVAQSLDQGATWKFLGIALDEQWHLSYPFVFTYDNQIFMMPEGSSKKELRLYRATNFPLEWKLEKVLMDKPLIDASMIHHEGYYWLFASDFTRHGVEKNAELEIWYSESPLGPWTEHKQNPVYKSDKSLGARNGGRLFAYEGSIYRPGQDCSGTYGKKVKLYRVEKLSKDEYSEVPVKLGIEESRKGRNAWNGIRYHHLDMQQLPSGGWIAVMDGDRVPSGDSTRRHLLGYAGIVLAASMTMLLGFLVGIFSCGVPSVIYIHLSRKSEGSRHRLNSKVRRLSATVSRHIASLRGRVGCSSCVGMFILSILPLTVLVGICSAIHFLHGGNGSDQAYTYKGQHSQFTMVTMTYEARLWNLKMYVEHYSKCESVREIVVVWNKGNPPSPDYLNSAVPVRVRVEETNSLNNRFRVDPLIKTRAVLELDDDIMMTCNDLEKGFRVWREHPERIVGFYPRLIDGRPLVYRDKKYARGKNGYNAVLTGAAFLDHEFAFKKYWSDEAKEARAFVHESFNCEDLLMNFLYANSSGERAVEYIHPAWAIDTSKLSPVAISRDTQAHYDARTKCLAKFESIFGPLPEKRWEFGTREDRWDK